MSAIVAVRIPTEGGIFADSFLHREEEDLFLPMHNSRRELQRERERTGGGGEGEGEGRGRGLLPTKQDTTSPSSQERERERDKAERERRLQQRGGGGCCSPKVAFTDEEKKTLTPSPTPCSSRSTYLVRSGLISASSPGVRVSCRPFRAARRMRANFSCLVFFFCKV